MDLKGKPIEMESLIEYQEGSVVSMEVIKKELGTVTVFAFDKGQGLSEHSAPFDAMVQIIDGEAEITLAGEPHTVKKIRFNQLFFFFPKSIFIFQSLLFLITIFKLF